jgi:hypothetical protein
MVRALPAFEMGVGLWFFSAFLTRTVSNRFCTHLCDARKSILFSCLPSVSAAGYLLCFVDASKKTLFSLAMSRHEWLSAVPSVGPMFSAHVC